MCLQCVCFWLLFSAALQTCTLLAHVCDTSVNSVCGCDLMGAWRGLGEGCTHAEYTATESTTTERCIQSLPSPPASPARKKQPSHLFQSSAWCVLCGRQQGSCTSAGIDRGENMFRISKLPSACSWKETPFDASHSVWLLASASFVRSHRSDIVLDNRVAPLWLDETFIYSCYNWEKAAYCFVNSKRSVWCLDLLNVWYLGLLRCPDDVISTNTFDSSSTERLSSLSRLMETQQTGVVSCFVP